MKKVLLALVLALVLAPAAFAAGKVITVGVTPFPHKDIMCRKIQHYYLGKDKDTILIIQTDVTTTYMQQVKETQRAKTEFERLSDILNGLTAGICVLQMPDAEHVRTSFCNRQMYRLLDIAPNASTFETMDKESDKLVSDYFQDEFSGAHPDDLPRMNGHIAKPIEPEILYLTLRNTFAKEDGN